MKRLLLLVSVLFLLVNICYSQSGNLLIIGGGSEESGTNAWNGGAYQWAVDQSGNKKVAVISYSSEYREINY